MYRTPESKVLASVCNEAIFRMNNTCVVKVNNASIENSNDRYDEFVLDDRVNEVCFTLHGIPWRKT